MPFLGRERGRASRYRRSDDEFVVFLQGIPTHCRWQELKDLVRQTAVHIRQAVVYDDNRGLPTGLGQIIVKNEDEAWRTYHRLSTNGWEGQSLVVTLARTSAPTKPIAGPTRSPPAMMQGYSSGYSTPPRSRGNATMPPSPISPESVQSNSPAYTYPEYGHMMGPLAMPPQPFMPMIQDPIAQPMQSYPPSPMMPCSMYDAPGWNMMPMYPMSPLQQFPDSRDYYPSYYPGKPKVNSTGPSTPIESSQQAFYMENPQTPVTVTGPERQRQGPQPIEQYNAFITNDAHDNQAQTNGSAVTFSTEEVKQGTFAVRHMPSMDSQTDVKTNQRASKTRNGSWGGTMSSQEEPEMHGPVYGGLEDEQGQRGQEKRVVPDRPLVVDGSGLQKRSLELLSTSAPS